MKFFGPLYSPFDLAIVVLVSFHLLLSLVAATSVLYFHLRSSSSASTPSGSLPHRLTLLLRLNSLWPVRLLLVLFSSLLSLFELIRLSRHQPHLCKAYVIGSQAFAEPAFFATLLFLLRASTEVKQSSSFSFSVAFITAISASFPFVMLHILYLVFGSWLLLKLNLPTEYFSPPSSLGLCSQPLFATIILACLGVIYVPLFVSACWGAVTVVINKKLRVRLYTLAAMVMVALSVQVSVLAFSSLWSPTCAMSKGLMLTAFVAMLVCVAVGEGILVVKPVLDALAIVMPNQRTCNSHGRDGDMKV